ncbi:MAG: hypothetical protein IKG08_09230 [Eubacterium sp.]|nr:hypothetical protein [Eubacterium sp.]
MKKQLFLTPMEGKQLIANALCENSDVLTAALEHTLVITAGTTNGFVAEALYRKLGLGEFDKSHFFRGVFTGRKLVPNSPAVDVIIRKGEVIEGKTIEDIAPELTAGDMIMKGGNALYLPGKQVGVAVGNPMLGTMSHVLPAVYGRRVSLLMPIGLEKRVEWPIDELEAFCNAPDMDGLRLAMAPGRPYTEIDAFESVGVSAVILASGGVEGKEGAILFGLEGDEKALKKAQDLAG